METKSVVEKEECLSEEYLIALADEHLNTLRNHGFRRDLGFILNAIQAKDIPKKQKQENMFIIKIWHEKCQNRHVFLRCDCISYADMNLTLNYFVKANGRLPVKKVKKRIPFSFEDSQQITQVKNWVQGKTVE